MLYLNSLYPNVLSASDLEKIHATSMKLLKKTGIEILSSEARKIMRCKGANVNQKKVFLSDNLVKKALGQTPTSFTIHARNPERNVTIGNSCLVLAPGYGAPFVIDKNKQRRNATFTDYINFTKLASASKYMDVVGGVLVEPTDLSFELKHKKMFYASAKYSDKPLMGSSSGEKKARDCLKMASILFGKEKGLIEDRPVLITLLDPITPLRYDRDTLAALIEYASHNQPVIIASQVVAGSTGPASLAGTLALQNAEVLAGLTLAQMIQPGTPVVYGSGSTATDMKTGNLVVGSPEQLKLIGATAQLARYYKVPSCVGGALTDSFSTDVQAGYESVLTLFATVNHEADLTLFSAGLLGSYMAMSYEKFIMDEEIIDIVQSSQTRISVSKETLARKVIKEAGPGGHFLTRDHTLKHMKNFWEPQISKRGSYESQSLKHSLTNQATKRYQDILTNFEPPVLDPEKERALTAFLEDNSYSNCTKLAHP